MKELNTNLKNIRNYFSLIYYQNNATKEETYNFLRECLKFTFDQNNLNVNDYDVTFHIPKHVPLQKSNAAMVANEKDPKKFDVFLNAESLKFKSIDDMDCLLYYIFVCYHEFGHIIQYVTKPDHMAIFDEDVILMQEAIEDFKCASHKTKFDRKIQRELEKYTDAQEIISYVEKDASKQAFTYYKAMLDQLIVHEQDDELADFFASVYANLQYIKKDEYVFYRKYHHQNKEALEFLKKHKLVEDVVIDA